MRFVNTFDPSMASSGTIPVGVNDPGQKVLMYNESPVTIQLNFTDGSNTYLHAWEANYWTFDDPAYEIEWTSVRNLIGSGQAPASYVDVFVYGVDEKVEGTYPVQLNRLTNLGNQSSTATVVSIINDNQASGTSVVESTQTGSSGSNVTIDNAGNMALKQYVSSTLTTLFQTIAGAAMNASNVKLSDASHQCEVIGNLLVDLALSVTGNATIGGTLGVTGNTTLSGTLTTTGDATFNGAGNGITVANNAQVNGNLTVNGTLTPGTFNPSSLSTTGNLTVSGTSTFTGDCTFNGAGNGISVTNNSNISGNESIGGTLSVTGASTLTGNVSAGGDVSLTTNNKFYKGKDQAGTTYPIAGFNSSTAKQLDVLDGTSGQLANIKSNTKVNGTLEATGATTLDSTLTVTGSSSLDSANITTDGSGNLTFVGNNKSITMHDHAGNSIQVMAFDGTTAQQLNILNAAFGSKLFKVFANTNLQNNLEVVGTSTLDGDVTCSGAGTGLSVTNNATVGGTLSATGNVICRAPAANSSQYQAINNSGTVVDVLYINTGGNTILQIGGAGKIFFRDSSSANIASIDSSGNMKLKGSLTQNTTP